MTKTTSPYSKFEVIRENLHLLPRDIMTAMLLNSWGRLSKDPATLAWFPEIPEYGIRWLPELSNDELVEILDMFCDLAKPPLNLMIDTMRYVKKGYERAIDKSKLP